MKELIRKCLLEAWSSSISGIDVDKAVELLHVRELNIIEKLHNYECVVESFVLDIEASTSLLIELRDEILILKDISSNNPNRLIKLNDFLDRINKQIAKNEQ